MTKSKKNSLINCVLSIYVKLTYPGDKLLTATIRPYLIYILPFGQCQPGSTIYGINCDSILDQVTTEPTLSPAEERMAYALRDIYFFGSFASLILLAIALFIFCMFK